MINESMKAGWGKALELKMSELRNRLEGCSIVAIEWDCHMWRVRLDDGTILTTWDCGCSLLHEDDGEALVQIEFEDL